MGIRVLQFAPSHVKETRHPCTVVRRDFVMSPGQLELELNLDHQVPMEFLYLKRKTRSSSSLARLGRSCSTTATRSKCTWPSSTAATRWWRRSAPRCCSASTCASSSTAPTRRPSPASTPRQYRVFWTRNSLHALSLLVLTHSTSAQVDNMSAMTAPTRSNQSHPFHSSRSTRSIETRDWTRLDCSLLGSGTVVRCNLAARCTAASRWRRCWDRPSPTATVWPSTDVSTTRTPISPPLRCEYRQLGVAFTRTRLPWTGLG